MEDKSNLEIVEKLRNENHGQFLTLCRMHLSFEIDLELENNDPVGPEKVKSRLWNKIQRKTGKCPLPSTSDTTPVLSQSIINQIRKLVSFLEKKESKSYYDMIYCIHNKPVLLAKVLILLDRPLVLIL